MGKTKESFGFDFAKSPVWMHLFNFCIISNRLVTPKCHTTRLRICMASGEYDQPKLKQNSDASQNIGWRCYHNTIHSCNKKWAGFHFSRISCSMTMMFWAHCWEPHHTVTQTARKKLFYRKVGLTVNQFIRKHSFNELEKE